MRRLVCILFLAAAIVSGFFIASAQAASTATFLDEQVLASHNTEITGESIVNLWRWYGIDVLPMLVILGAESSLGDPALGGGSVPSHNYGNIKWAAGRDDTRWQSLASGRWYCPGQGWYLVFPSPEIGLMAWGRYMKVGMGGAYRPLLEAGDWTAFARIYYGAGVPGLGTYTANLYALESRFRARAATAGFLW